MGYPLGIRVMGIWWNIMLWWNHVDLFCGFCHEKSPVKSSMKIQLLNQEESRPGIRPGTWLWKGLLWSKMKQVSSIIPPKKMLWLCMTQSQFGANDSSNTTVPALSWTCFSTQESNSCYNRESTKVSNNSLTIDHLGRCCKAVTLLVGTDYW